MSERREAGVSFARFNMAYGTVGGDPQPRPESPTDWGADAGAKGVVKKMAFFALTTPLKDPDSSNLIVRIYLIVGPMFSI